MPKSPSSRLATRLTDVVAPVAASNTNTLIGAVFTRPSRSARARCSPRVPAGIGDHQRSLGGENGQSLLVLGAEPPPLSQ